MAAFEGDAVGTCAGSTIDGVVGLEHPLTGGGRMRLAVPVRSGRLGTVLYAAAENPARTVSIVGPVRRIPARTAGRRPSRESWPKAR